MRRNVVGCVWVSLSSILGAAGGTLFHKGAFDLKIIVGSAAAGALMGALSASIMRCTSRVPLLAQRGQDGSAGVGIVCTSVP